MKGSLLLRERLAWVTVVAVLATSVLWLVAVAAAVLLRSHGAEVTRAMEIGLAVARALLRATLAVAWHGRLTILATLAAAGVTATLMGAVRPRVEGRVRHG